MEYWQFLFYFIYFPVANTHVMQAQKKRVRKFCISQKNNHYTHNFFIKDSTRPIQLFAYFYLKEVACFLFTCIAIHISVALMIYIIYCIDLQGMICKNWIYTHLLQLFPDLGQKWTRKTGKIFALIWYNRYVHRGHSLSTDKNYCSWIPAQSICLLYIILLESSLYTTWVSDLYLM